MLYTRMGDNGETGLFHCDQRLSKSSDIAEALGVVDEINSLLGLLRTRVKGVEFRVQGYLMVEEIIEEAQQNLFVVQAVLAGADKKLSEEKISKIESIIDSIEKEMPTIHSFFLSGGAELSALFDYARAVCRRAERRVVAVSEKKELAPEILKYMNRLSSLFYALARWINFKSGTEQIPPSY